MKDEDRVILEVPGIIKGRKDTLEKKEKKEEGVFCLNWN